MSGCMGDRVKASLSPSLIPDDRIHQIWMTGDVPARFAALGASWREQHPSWEYRLWTDASLERVREGRISRRCGISIAAIRR